MQKAPDVLARSEKNPLSAACHGSTLEFLCAIDWVQLVALLLQNRTHFTAGRGETHRWVKRLLAVVFVCFISCFPGRCRSWFLLALPVASPSCHGHQGMLSLALPPWQLHCCCCFVLAVLGSVFQIRITVLNNSYQQCHKNSTRDGKHIPDLAAVSHRARVGLYWWRVSGQLQGKLKHLSLLLQPLCSPTPKGPFCKCWDFSAHFAKSPVCPNTPLTLGETQHFVDVVSISGL